MIAPAADLLAVKYAMPPRISLLAPRRIAFRTKCIPSSKRFSRPQPRFASNDASGPPIQENPGEPPSGANESQLPHVSEEQAAMDKITGEEPVEVDQHGTPVQEILKRDKDFQDKAPEVLKQEMNTGQKRSYSTSARRLSEGGLESSSGGSDVMLPSMLQSVQFDGTRASGLQYPDAGLGHKFSPARHGQLEEHRSSQKTLRPSNRPGHQGNYERRETQRSAESKSQDRLAVRPADCLRTCRPY